MPPGFHQSLSRHHFDHLRAHTIGTNVSQDSLLTTDYLNHFNEVVMLLHLLPTAPLEIAADLADWKPKSYEDHSESSGFRDKALAIAGYQNSRAMFAMPSIRRSVIWSGNW